MDTKQSGSLYYIIPAEVIHDPDLNLFEKMIYALVSGLSNKYGYCFASNEHLQEILHIEIRKIQRHLQTLEEKGYIRREIESDDKNPFKKIRKIFITATFKKCLPDVTSDMSGDDASDMSVMSPVTCVLSEEKKLISEEKNPAAPASSADASALFDFFLKKIKERNPSFKDPKKDNWIKEFELMIKNDGRKPEEITILIEWIHTHSFWKSTCLSPSSLRKQYDKILMQMQSDSEKKNVDENRYYVLEAKEVFPEKLKNLTINQKYAMNLPMGKEVPFSLPKESFRKAFVSMFGGRYEQNRRDEPRDTMVEHGPYPETE